MSPGWVRAPSAVGVRPPSVAGSFYPGSADRLGALVSELVDEAGHLAGAAGPAPLPIGVLVPHAGLVYSGATAAAAWRLLAPHRGASSPGHGDGRQERAERGLTIVILGTNHGAGWLDGIGAWDRGAWQTPLGSVPVDDGLAGEIVALGPPFGLDLEAHHLEHSIEVQLPLIQQLVPDARIVPLAVSCGRGPRAVAAGQQLGNLLRTHRDRQTELVLAISTDMAHYPPADACRRVTETLLPPILAVDGPGLADREAAVRDARVPGLSCGMCGIEPAILGLAALRTMGVTHGTRLASATSADAIGPTDRTVGYLAARFDA